MEPRNQPEGVNNPPQNNGISEFNRENPPRYNPPGYNQPGYNQPGYNQPGYNQPGYNQPGYNQPLYSQPVPNQQIYNQPYFANPAQPVYAVPGNQMSRPLLVVPRFFSNNSGIIGLIVLTIMIIAEVILIIICITNVPWFYYCNFQFSLYKIYGYGLTASYNYNYCYEGSEYIEMSISDFSDQYSYYYSCCPDLFDSIDPLKNNGYILLAFGLFSIIVAGLVNFIVIAFYKKQFLKRLGRIGFNILNLIPLFSYLIGYVVYITASKFSDNFRRPFNYYDYSYEYSSSFSWGLGYDCSIICIVLMGFNALTVYITAGPAFRVV
jgi:hypothetical protein